MSTARGRRRQRSERQVVGERRSHFGSQNRTVSRDENSITFMSNQMPAFEGNKRAIEHEMNALHAPAPVSYVAPPPMPPTPPNAIDEIAKLADLKDEGAITEE